MSGGQQQQRPLIINRNASPAPFAEERLQSERAPLVHDTGLASSSGLLYPTTTSSFSGGGSRGERGRGGSRGSDGPERGRSWLRQGADWSWSRRDSEGSAGPPRGPEAARGNRRSGGRKNLCGGGSPRQGRGRSGDFGDCCDEENDRSEENDHDSVHNRTKSFSRGFVLLWTGLTVVLVLGIGMAAYFICSTIKAAERRNTGRAGAAHLRAAVESEPLPSEGTTAAGEPTDRQTAATENAGGPPHDDGAPGTSAVAALNAFATVTKVLPPTTLHALPWQLPMSFPATFPDSDWMIRLPVLSPPTAPSTPGTTPPPVGVDPNRVLAVEARLQSTSPRWVTDGWDTTACDDFPKDPQICKAKGGAEYRGGANKELAVLTNGHRKWAGDLAEFVPGDVGEWGQVVEGDGTEFGGDMEGDAFYRPESNFFSHTRAREADDLWRIRILQNTLNVLRSPAKRELVRNVALSNVGRWSNANTKKVVAPPRPIFRLVKGDWGDVLMSSTKHYGVVHAALNAANAFTPFGGAHNGRSAQEENMARRTDIWFSVPSEDADLLGRTGVSAQIPETYFDGDDGRRKYLPSVTKKIEMHDGRADVHQKEVAVLLRGREQGRIT